MSPANPDGTSSRAAWSALAAAAASIVAATWSILGHRSSVAAGAWAAAAGAALVAGSVLASRSFPPAEAGRWRYLDSAFDRAFDGAILGAIAWTTRSSDRSACAGALIAIGGGFLGTYVRARGAALGYGVTEGRFTRAVRYGLVAAGLLADALSWAMWANAAVGLGAALVRSSQVAKEERA